MIALALSVFIAAPCSTPRNQPPRRGRRIIWLNVSTVISAAILIGAEVFGAAFAGSWAFGNLFELGDYARTSSTVCSSLLGLVIMVQFVRYAQRIEPFTARKLSGDSLRADASQQFVKETLRARQKKSACIRRKLLISVLAQFRTCLWSCVGR